MKPCASSQAAGEKAGGHKEDPNLSPVANEGLLRQWPRQWIEQITIKRLAWNKECSYHLIMMRVIILIEGASPQYDHVVGYIRLQQKLYHFKDLTTHSIYM